MLLGLRLPSPFLAPARRLEADLSSPRREADAGEIHPCGLRHRSSLQGWPSLSGLIWWALRAN